MLTVKQNAQLALLNAKRGRFWASSNAYLTNLSKVKTKDFQVKNLYAWCWTTSETQILLLTSTWNIVLLHYHRLQNSVNPIDLSRHCVNVRTHVRFSSNCWWLQIQFVWHIVNYCRYIFRGVFRTQSNIYYGAFFFTKMRK